MYAANAGTTTVRVALARMQLSHPSRKIDALALIDQESLMSRSSSNELQHTLRSLPVMFAALLAVVGAVDVLLLTQPKLLAQWSMALRRMVSVAPVPAPAMQLLAAALAACCVVLCAAAAILVAKAVQAAPHATIGPVWVSLCMVAIARVPHVLQLPMSLPIFLSLTGIFFISAPTFLSLGGHVGKLFGWTLLFAPIVLFVSPYVIAAKGHALDDSAWTLLLGLVLSAGGALASAWVQRGAHDPRQVQGLEGVDVVDELFTQVERAERAESRVADLERQVQRMRAKQAPPPRSGVR